MSPSIGGVETGITDEVTAQPGYEYELIDNSFWDVENPKSAEMSFINMFRSRILASAEYTAKQAQRDYYIKTANSLTGFFELFPITNRGLDQVRFNRRVMDFWFAAQNPGTVEGYAAGVSAYTGLPTFLKRQEDTADNWILDESWVDEDNYLLGYTSQRNGIQIDALGIALMPDSIKEECYRNVMNSIADLAPVVWEFHNEVQPTGYLVFADRYNSFDSCDLTNMYYDVDNTILPYDASLPSQFITPMLSTSRLDITALVSTETGMVSGAVELSVHDRVYREDVSRTIYYRQGTSGATMGAWTEVTRPVGQVLSIVEPYVQFKFEINNVSSTTDYGFVSLALRNYTSARDWTRTAT